MGDVQTSKRQAVVDRLRRRVESYRRHQAQCNDKYDTTTNGAQEKEMQDTHKLRQYVLEAKAKKTKKSDSLKKDLSGQNALVPRIMKRSADELDPSLETEDGASNEKASKMPKTGGSGNNKSGDSNNMKFQVEIVQQLEFSTSGGTPQSQQIQTNVTVKTMAGTTIKTENSPTPGTPTSATPTPATPTPENNSSSQNDMAKEFKQEPEEFPDALQAFSNDDSLSQEALEALLNKFDFPDMADIEDIDYYDVIEEIEEEEKARDSESLNTPNSSTVPTDVKPQLEIKPSPPQLPPSPAANPPPQYSANPSMPAAPSTLTVNMSQSSQLSAHINGPSPHMSAVVSQSSHMEATMTQQQQHNSATGQTFQSTVTTQAMTQHTTTMQNDMSNRMQPQAQQQQQQQQPQPQQAQPQQQQYNSVAQQYYNMQQQQQQQQHFTSVSPTMNYPYSTGASVGSSGMQTSTMNTVVNSNPKMVPSVNQGVNPRMPYQNMQTQAQNVSGGGMNFEKTSPAAQTLKQMAEQHQQQKQHMPVRNFQEMGFNGPEFMQSNSPNSPYMNKPPPPGYNSQMVRPDNMEMMNRQQMMQYQQQQQQKNMMRVMRPQTPPQQQTANQGVIPQGMATFQQTRHQISQNQQMKLSDQQMQINQTQNVQVQGGPGGFFPAGQLSASQAQSIQLQQQQLVQQQQQQQQQVGVPQQQQQPTQQMIQYQRSMMATTASGQQFVVNQPAGLRLMRPRMATSGQQLPPSGPLLSQTVARPPSAIAASSQMRSPPVVQQTMNAAPSPRFTSPLMRGHRPPNVNVGPEGLNIGTATQHWRQVMTTQQQRFPQHMQPQFAQQGNYPTRLPMQALQSQSNNPGMGRVPNMMTPQQQVQMNHVSLSQSQTVNMTGNGAQQQNLPNFRTLQSRAPIQMQQTMAGRQFRAQQPPLDLPEFLDSIPDASSTFDAQELLSTFDSLGGSSNQSYSLLDGM